MLFGLIFFIFAMLTHVLPNEVRFQTLGFDSPACFPNPGPIKLLKPWGLQIPKPWFLRNPAYLLQLLRLLPCQLRLVLLLYLLILLRGPGVAL